MQTSKGCGEVAEIDLHFQRSKIPFESARFTHCRPSLRSLGQFSILVGCCIVDMSALERCMGSSDGGVLAEASRELGIAAIPKTPLLTSADTLPIPQVSVLAGRALPANTVVEVPALELMGAVGTEFAAMLSSEAQAAHLDERVFRVSTALRQSGLSDSEIVASESSGPASSALAPAAEDIAQSAALRAGALFAPRHVAAAALRLGYARIAEAVGAYSFALPAGSATGSNGQTSGSATLAVSLAPPAPHSE